MMVSALEGTKGEPHPQISNPNQYHLSGGLHKAGDVMREEKSTSLSGFHFPRSHLDSDTYRSFARILTHFLDHTANTSTQPPPSASALHGTAATAVDDTATGQDAGLHGDRSSNDSLGMDHFSNDKQGDELLNMDVFNSLNFNDGNVDQDQLLTIHKDFSDCISPRVQQQQQQQQQKYEDATHTSDVEEVEDGEILNELGDAVRFSYSENYHVGGIGDGKDRDKLIEEIVERRDNFDRERDGAVDKRDDLYCVRGQAVVKSYELNCGQASFTCKEDDIAVHHFTRITNTRNNNPHVVDYSDLYCSDPAAYKGNMLRHTSKGGKGRSTRNNDTGDKPLGPPINDKGRMIKDDDGSHVSIPTDSTLHRSIFSMKEPIQNLDKESNSMIDEIVEMKKKKKKNGPLTEERKAKRKQAKKRKRAEQNRKLGIKRLKIEPIIKPKKVVYCDFYLKGKCQKGNLCTFSHDTIPLTKSQPCKYFASESCLKGDDCPFDHDLSKYPCHNFMYSGTCSRGEACKFSHKISGANNSFVNKPESLWPSEKQPRSTTLVNAFDNSPAKVAPHTSRPLLNHLGEQRAGKLVMKIPEGTNFISFGINLSGEENSEKNQCLEKHLVNHKTSSLNNDKPAKTTNNIPNTATQQAQQPTNKSIMKVPRGIHFLSFNKDVAKEAKSKDEFCKRSDGIKQDKAPTITQNVSDVSLGSPGLLSSSPQNKVLSVDVQNPIVKWAEELHSRGRDISTTGAEKSTGLSISPTGSKESITNYSSKLVETSSRSINNNETDAFKIFEEFLFCGNTT